MTYIKYVISDTFSSKIPLWIKIHGIPLHCYTINNLWAIAKHLGSYLDHNVEDDKIKVLVDARKLLLVRQKSIQFLYRLEFSIDFEYINFRTIDSNPWKCHVKKKIVYYSIVDPPQLNLQASINNSHSSD